MSDSRQARRDCTEQILRRADEMSGSRQARRDCTEQILGPTRGAPQDLQELEVRTPVSQGAAASFKNLILAAAGAKPQTVLRDAVNNDAETVRRADTCPVSTAPPPPHGVTWRQTAVR